MNRERLVEILENILGEPINALISAHIDRFYSVGYNYKDMARAMVYLYDVKKNPKDKLKQFGLGLLPTIMGEANAYYDKMKAMQENQKRFLEQPQSIQEKEVKVQYSNVKRKKEVDLSEL